MRADVLNSNSASYGEQYKTANIKKVTADTTLTAADSGKVILVNPAAQTTITLPDVGLEGWYCTVILTEGIAATDGSMDQIVNVDMGSGVNLINIGQVHTVDGAGDAGNFAVAGDDFFVFIADATPGDRAEFLSTGTQWVCQAYVKDLTDADFSTGAGSIA